MAEHEWTWNNREIKAFLVKQGVITVQRQMLGELETYFHTQRVVQAKEMYINLFTYIYKSLVPSPERPV